MSAIKQVVSGAGASEPERGIQHRMGYDSQLKSGEFRLYSRKKDESTGKRRNLGTFSTLEKAKQHEREASFSRSADKVIMASSAAGEKQTGLMRAASQGQHGRPGNDLGYSRDSGALSSTIFPAVEKLPARNCLDVRCGGSK